MDLTTKEGMDKFRKLTQQTKFMIIAELIDIARSGESAIEPAYHERVAELIVADVQ